MQKKLKINIITLGCSKNLVESEYLMNQIKTNKIEVFHDSDRKDFDAVIINTCGFILDAKEESINTILDYIELKEQGKIKKVYVIGCLSERYKDELREEMPEVDKYFGNVNVEEIIKELQLEYNEKTRFNRIITTPSHYAYLKIAEGCDRTCSFCAIPLIKGAYTSRPIEDIVAEAKYLKSKKVREIILIAQDLTYYGYDLKSKVLLPELVKTLAESNDFDWIRLNYAYPAKFPTEIIQIMKEYPNVCRYLDIPLQHINDGILKNMRRGMGANETIKLLEYIRKEIPEIALRTTFLVGHPGEGQKEFDELKKFVQDFKFDRMGVFAYSHEENTYAAKKYKDLISDEVKQKRVEELMEIQQNISYDKNKAKLGKVYKTIIDREESEYYVGRTEFDSPEVDNEVVIFKNKASLKVGEFYDLEITASAEFDLYAEPLK
ncbi:MAG TPA: 30S ribosomal protein S12 methylthiotransferase RimO [Bacteroidales bacterium]|nr:MAG: ribosomal protein S12 methylthiotransferase RimO [Bacteroidetes bacterium GWF2_33_38]OFY74500.1 MAG: ribosomal protein S12 methylthiotransferase RimO [Bacteroidetes bacterium RIFOXYA12_FULL_33_9]HBF87949.1 30S ribosomal protein S12 methylthiotransferase RimO [Bacteroidales bacterium]